MTPKEKAQELFQLFYFPHYKFNNETGTSVIDEKLTKIVQKRFALIAVDEILNVIEDEREGFNWKSYYLEVKQEIEKL
jgi:hypothetical protein